MKHLSIRYTYALAAFSILPIHGQDSAIVKAIIAKYCTPICSVLRQQVEDELLLAYNRRQNSNYNDTIANEPVDISAKNNGDEKNVALFAANFTKLFEHDAVTGLLTNAGVASYKIYLNALSTGTQDAYNAIIRANPASPVKFVSPQAGFAFNFDSKDSTLYNIPQFPHLSSAEMGALILEVYLMAICRDVEFNQYGTGLGTDADGSGGSLTNDAADVLQSLGVAYRGPRNGVGVVDASVLFRSSGVGELDGPYVSQFFLLPIKQALPAFTGVANLNQTILVWFNQQRQIAQNREFSVSFSDFVGIENGLIPRPYAVTDYDAVNKRFIIDGRDIGSFVHYDIPGEAFYNAYYILCAFGFPFSPALPYQDGSITNEAPFTTMGKVDIFGAIGAVTYECMKAAWAQKWRAYRAGRPEAICALVDRAKVTGNNQFHLDSTIFNSIFIQPATTVLDRILTRNQAQVGLPGNVGLTLADSSTYLLAQMYPEASPSHPSYPSGHATISGACATILKAFFDDQALIVSKVPPVMVDPANAQMLVNLAGPIVNQLTVGGELNKLAGNVANARNFAGVHWRNDGDNGVLLGEQVAISYLQDHCCTYQEPTFSGFVFTKFDGTRIRVTSGGVTVF